MEREGISDRQKVETIVTALWVYWRQCCNMLCSTHNLEIVLKYRAQANAALECIDELKELKEESKKWI